MTTTAVEAAWDSIVGGALVCTALPDTHSTDHRRLNGSGATGRWLVGALVHGCG